MEKGRLPTKAVKGGREDGRSAAAYTLRGGACGGGASEPESESKSEAKSEAKSGATALPALAESWKGAAAAAPPPVSESESEHSSAQFMASLAWMGWDGRGWDGICLPEQVVR
jgi:hypothetical protein